MAEKRRVNLTLTLNSALHRQAWTIIKKIPTGQRTEQICRILCNYENKQQDEFLQSIRSIMREELQSVSVQTNYISREDQEPQSVSDDVLGFLRSLQEGDGIG